MAKGSAWLQPPQRVSIAGMKTSDDAALALLHSMLRICRDSVEGYATAARDVPDAELAAVFERYRTERVKLVSELEDRIVALRGDAHASPTLGGAVHRAWMDYRAGSDSNPSQALLAEIERGEDMAVTAIRQALKEHDIDDATRRLFEHLYELIQAAHDRIKQLRDRANLAQM
jgi:uncharacterized protein (TIGR02284 family)